MKVKMVRNVRELAGILAAYVKMDIESPKI